MAIEEESTNQEYIEEQEDEEGRSRNEDDVYTCFPFWKNDILCASQDKPSILRS